MDNIKRIQEKLAGLDGTQARDALLKARKLATKAEAFKAVTGGIPDSVISTIDSLLTVAVPITAFLGDYELTGLLNSLKLWVQKKKMENEAEDRQMTEMQGVGLSDYWFS